MRRATSFLAAGSTTLSLLLGASIVDAGSISTDGLGLPVRCILGETCWIANYVDVDPSQAAQDFHCRPRTYNGHDGVDIAIRDLGVMREGVTVVASAPGTVRNVRDGMDDLPASDAASRTRVGSRECGNGVVIQHGDGWETQYCHLRRGSVRVKPGDRVERGTPIGLVGLSGATEFPHLHLTVRHDGVAIDPFTGQASTAGCGTPGSPLWRPDQSIAYEEVALYNAGFTAEQPDSDRIRRGEPVAPIDASAPALVFWVDMLGVQAGDTVRISITAPGGQRIVERDQTIDRTQARRFAFAGKRRGASGWPAGTYIGEAVLIRQGQGQPLQRSISRKMTIAR